MSISRLICSFFVGIVACHFLLATASAQDAAPVAVAVKTVDVKALIKELGDGNFRTRRAAEEALKACDRTIFPVLYPLLKSGDPEIEVRVGRIITHILTDPSCIPTSFHVFAVADDANLGTQRRDWEKTLADWRAKGKVAASHLAENASTASDFAQSFKPGCETIAAIELGVYPAGYDSGWVRVDLVADNQGWPGSVVLARSWVKMDKRSPVPHGTATPFDIRDVQVDPEKTYWLCFREFPIEGQNNCIVNYNLTQDSSFKDGKMIRKDTQAPSENEDAKFRILSAAEAPPLMAAATEEQCATIPKGEEAGRIWQERPNNNANQPHNLMLRQQMIMQGFPNAPAQLNIQIQGH